MDIYAARQELKFKKLQDLHLRVVHYDRVSTEKEEQKSSIVNQNFFSEEMIRSNPNWVYAGRYADEAITGLSTEKRPGFSQMMLDAKLGKFDLIITKEVPRFARNTLDSIQCSRKLLQYGVGVWFINNNLNTISEESEFTPKNIQTRDERADLVYAVKVAIPDGNGLRLGMYAYIMTH